jgi:hypothetical protein
MILWMIAIHAASQNWKKKHQVAYYSKNPFTLWWGTNDNGIGESPKNTSKGHPMEIQKSFMCGVELEV